MKTKKSQNKKSKAPYQRVLLIGIDGGSFDVLKPLIAKGKMPVLGKLIGEGASGHLKSTHPPITGPAWKSFATGTNPGKHGIIDFVELDYETKQVNVTDGGKSLIPTLWDEIGSHDLKVGVMGVPMTYPAHEVNGFMLTGLMTPPNSDRYYYPADLGEDLQKENLRWPTSEGENAIASDSDKYIDALVLDMEARVDTALNLMDKHDPSFVSFVFGASDPLQHQFFHAITSNEDKELSAKVEYFFEELDKQIGRLLAYANDKTLVMVMSDHGFGPLKGFIHLNNWLMEKGYLKLRKNFSTSFVSLLYKLGYTPENLYQIARFLKLDVRRRLNRGRVYSITRRLFLSFQNVDWENSTAYSLGHIGQIYVHSGDKSKKELRELMDKLKAELLDIRDPKTNEKLIRNVFEKEEIYSGPKTNNAPDLILEPEEYKYVAFGESEFASNKIIGSALHSGHHRLEGILTMNGHNVLSGKELDISKIEDIMPTVLYALGLPIPSYVDGKVIADAFPKNHIVENPPVFEERSLPEDDQEGAEYSETDEELVRQRLRDLGYMA